MAEGANRNADNVACLWGKMYLRLRIVASAISSAWASGLNGTVTPNIASARYATLRRHRRRPELQPFRHRANRVAKGLG